jgi:abhydrolase domain-containing protein 6
MPGAQWSYTVVVGPEVHDTIREAELSRTKKGFVVLAALLFMLAGVYVALPQLFFTPLVSLNRALSGLAEKTVVVDEHEVHYLEGGAGETVLLLHGIFAEKDHWVEFARQLTPHYRVIALDIPGFGESTRLDDARYEYPDQLRRLHAFIQRLQLERVHLAGNSMGGTIAALYAIEHPERVRTVALIGAPHGIRSPRPSEADRRIENGEIPLIARSRDEFDGMLALLFEERPFLPRPILDDAARRAVAGSGSNLRLWQEQRSQGYALQDRLPELKAPTLTLWGEQDRVFDVSGVEVIRELLPGQPLVVMPGTGHLPMMERPRETARLYLDFLGHRPAVHPAAR